MKRRNRKVALVAAILMIALAWWWRATDPSLAPASRLHPALLETNRAMGSDLTRATLKDRIFGLAAGLRGAPGQPEVIRRLATFQGELAQAPHGEAAAVVRDFLDTGEDTLTHLGFKLNADGSLAEAPTLRTFLLDQLAMLDPLAAARYAEKILQTKTSPDEWAVSLRAWAKAMPHSAGRQFLVEKSREMARYEPWQTNPSVGFLEAFDVFVHTRDTGFVPDLAGFVRDKENRAMGHAAFLTLDLLVQSDPTATLQTLLEQPDLMAGREETRANYFARADVRDTAQKNLLASYLLSSTRSAAELNTFAGLFPNANFMVSHNLLTPSTTLANDELRRRDDAALKTIDEWLVDDRFQKVRLQLNQIRTRLGQFRKPEP